MDIETRGKQHPNALRNINDVPNEVLQNILKYISGKDAIRYRLVSKRWRDNIDDDSNWKIYCLNDFFNAEEEFRKTNLTWRQLYKSLMLWYQVGKVNVKAHQDCFLVSEPRDFVTYKNYFGILKRRPKGDRKVKVPKDVDKYRNCIIYFDVDTLEKDHIQYFEKEFFVCKENDSLYVIACPETEIGESMDLSVYVIPKVNKRMFYVGKVYCLDDTERGAITLINDMICFKNASNHIVVARLQGEEVQAEISIIPFNPEIVTFNNYNDKLHIFTSAAVYSYADKEYKKLIELTTFKDIRNKVEAISIYGFQWHQPENLAWIVSTSCTLSGNMLITGDVSKLHFYNAMDGDGSRNFRCFIRNDVNRFRMRQDSCLNIKLIPKWCHFFCGHNHIPKIRLHAVCRPTGQRLFLLKCGTLFVLDFEYGSSESNIANCKISLINAVMREVQFDD